MINPEYNILNRTLLLVKDLAAVNTFVASENEAVQPVSPTAVQLWKVVEGTQLTQGSPGVTNLLMPGILVTPMVVETSSQGGLNCADDEKVRVAIQIVDNNPHTQNSVIRTYGDWLIAIRNRLTVLPTPFQQDADQTKYDPWLVNILRRVPADARRLLQTEQTVAMMVFEVQVRHHR